MQLKLPASLSLQSIYPGFFCGRLPDVAKSKLTPQAQNGFSISPLPTPLSLPSPPPLQSGQTLRDDRRREARDCIKERSSKYLSTLHNHRSREHQLEGRKEEGEEGGEGEEGEVSVMGH